MYPKETMGECVPTCPGVEPVAQLRTVVLQSLNLKWEERSLSAWSLSQPINFFSYSQDSFWAWSQLCTTPREEWRVSGFLGENELSVQY